MPEAEDAIPSCCAPLEDPAIRVQPVEGADDALANGQLRLPSERANARGVEEDERVVADPAALAARIGQLGIDAEMAARSSQSNR